MRVPIGWLQDYVAFADSPQGLAEKLTFSGLEVEGLETHGCAAPGVVVGEVLAVDRHPNADKLTLCLVNFGAGALTVVCGAPNARVGLKAPFAPAGVTLPNGLTLKKAKIRGVVSEGMLCAADELGLSTDHSGLLELDARWAPGTPLAEVLGPPETVLELEVTPNRPDCLCLIGIAREVAALYGTQLRRPEIQLAEHEPGVEQLTRVTVEDAVGCPRYTARILAGVQIGPSPAWMQRRLELAGVRAINNVVDITNYVMLECGQPLHAFDQALLAEGRIVVRRARPGEKMATLDGLGRDLTPSMLIIADARQPVAVAGVMGGAGSEIRAATRTVLLESACFQPADIRHTARQLGLATESSYRFERGVDLAGVEWASRRAAALMAACAGAHCARGVLDVGAAPPAPRSIRCRYEVIRARIGVAVPDENIRAIFQSLELTVQSPATSVVGGASATLQSGETPPCSAKPATQGEEESLRSTSSPERGAGSPAHEEAASGVCEVTIPSFRPDLAREVDLVEEVARLHGLERIPAPTPRAQLVAGAGDRPALALALCRQHLVGLGLREIMNYSFVAASLLDQFDPADAPRRLVLPNPVSQEEGVLRNALAPQLVATLGRNHARQLPAAALFEIGRVFQRDAQGQPAEEEHLVLGLMGAVGSAGLDRRQPPSAEETFLGLKGLWEALLQALHVRAWTCRAAPCPQGAAGWSVALFVDEQPVGTLCLLRAELARAWRLIAPVAVLEARLAPLLPRAFDVARVATPAPYPSIRRDMALLVPRTLQHAEIVRLIRRAAPPELENVELFDIFEGESLGAERQSIAYACTYRAADRTLTDAEANAYHDRIKAAVKVELGVEVRET